MSIEFQVTFDAHDPGRLAEFWAAALDYTIQPPPPPFGSWPEALAAWGLPEDQWNSRSAIVDPDGGGPRVFFQQVPEDKAGKNRLHLDLRRASGLRGDERMSALEAEATRLEALGATRLYRIDADAIDEGFITMADPEGNEFCLD